MSDIDLTGRLRFAAGALAADLGDEISVDHAEALVFSSAESLLAAASVTEFVPILAERRARLAARSTARAAGAPPATRSPVQDPEPVQVAPLLAVPEREIIRLRHDLERLRKRVADWRSDAGRPGQPPT